MHALSIPFLASDCIFSESAIVDVTQRLLPRPHRKSAATSFIMHIEPTTWEQIKLNSAQGDHFWSMSMLLPAECCAVVFWVCASYLGKRVKPRIRVMAEWWSQLRFGQEFPLLVSYGSRAMKLKPNSIGRCSDHRSPILRSREGWKGSNSSGKLEESFTNTCQ